MVIWYGGIKSLYAGKVPQIVLFFKQLEPDGSLSQGNMEATVSMAYLGQFRIGSVWRDGCSTRQLVFEEFFIECTYSFEEHWKPEQREHISVKNFPHLIPPDDYQLKFPRGDRSPMLRFTVNGKSLLLPCTEYLARCYASNFEVTRVLITYEDADVTDRLLLQEPISPESDAWPVWLPERCPPTDGFLLAHLRYGKASSKKVKSIKAQIDQQLNGDKQSHAFVCAGPWFEGKARLEVQGILLRTGEFLGLRVVGYSLPTTPPVSTYRKVSDQPSEGEMGKFLRPQRKTIDIPEGETVPTAQQLVSDTDTDIHAVEDSSIRILGTHAKLTYQTVSRDTSRPTIRVPSAPSDVSAPGDSSGTKKGVGKAEFIANAMLESEGAVHDLWEGLHQSLADNPSLIQSVGWCNAEGEFETDPHSEPGYLRLPDPPPHYYDAKKIYAWLNKSTLKSSRGVFISRIVTTSFTGYLFEVQRAPVKAKDGADPNKVSEESYSGLAAVPPKDANVSEWIANVMAAITLAKGIMSTALRIFKYSSGDFYHRSIKTGDQMPGYRTANRALEKLGVDGLLYSGGFQQSD